MNIGILSVKNHRYHPNRRLIQAATEMGHTPILLHPGRFFMGLDGQGFTLEYLGADLRLDVLIPRIGATIKEYGHTLLRHFELAGIRVINRYDSVLLARNKFLTLQTLRDKGIPVPESRYASNRSNFDRAVAHLGGFPVVVKKPNSRQGSGVFLMSSLRSGEAFISDLLNTGRGVLIQEFVRPEKRRDIRALVIGKKVLGAMVLTPKRGDFRANVHLGAHGEKLTPTREITALAINSTKALGLDIAGVDMIEKEGGLFRVIEVNYSPGFRGFERCTGVDVASEIIRFCTKPMP
jgi:ribosomal protein S6--L-glutamate ligase